MVHGRPRKRVRQIQHRIGYVAPGSVGRRVFVGSVVPKESV